jgi:hypothetical protein
MSSLKEGALIPFLGAGASLNRDAPGEEHLPTGTELANFLAKTTAFPEDEGIDLAKVAQYYYSVAAGREPLYKTLHKIFDHDYPLAQIHTFLASIDTPLLIVTTNYDDLIERAFKEQGRPFDVVIHNSDPTAGSRPLWFKHGTSEPDEVSANKLLIDIQKTTVVYKMHGAVDRLDPARDQYVITEDDYVDFLTRMTSSKAIPAFCNEPFQTRHFLFLGYSLRDWNLRVILNRIQASRKSGKKSWAIQYQPSAIERRFWQDRGIEVYDMPLNEFVQQLSIQQ